MAVVLSCPHCKVKMKVRDEVLGKKLRCRKCKGVFRALKPDGSGASAEDSAKKTSATPVKKTVGTAKPAATTKPAATAKPAVPPAPEKKVVKQKPEAASPVSKPASEPEKKPVKTTKPSPAAKKETKAKAQAPVSDLDKAMLKDMLKVALDKKNEVSLRADALASIRTLKSGAVPALKEISDLIDDESESMEVKVAAVKVLGSSGSDSVYEFIESAMGQYDEALTLAGIQAFDELREPRCLVLMLRILKRSSNHSHRSAAAETLADLRDAAAKGHYV